MITSIPKTGSVECRKCGEVIIADLKARDGYARCVCGALAHYGQAPIVIPEIFELFGYQLSVDWDGELLVESDSEVPYDVRKWLFEHQGEIRSTFEWEGRIARTVYVGGSLDGRRHAERYPYWAADISRVYRHIGKRHWETYEFRDKDDPRLFYVGRSTSKAKAKRGCFVTEQCGGQD